MPAASSPAIARRAYPTAVPQLRPGQHVPEQIAAVLAIVGILTEYGRHLADTLPRRAAARSFATIAQCFGTATVAVILAHLYRGIMRAVALERLLVARALRGRELRVLARRAPAPRQPAAPGPSDALARALATLPPEAAALLTIPPAATLEAQAAARRASRLARQEPLTLDNLPSMPEIEAEVRRTPIGRTLTAICRDLGVAFGLCETSFGNRLFDAIRWYGGNPGSVLQEMRRREAVFENTVLDRGAPLDWPEASRDGIRRVLGFFVGETPACPIPAPPRSAAPATIAAADAPAAPGATSAVAATGPP